MTEQPFDAYKNKGVEYDYIIDATASVKDLSDNDFQQIIFWLGDEDYVAQSFPKIALGRVYGKVSADDNLLKFKFGISLVDAVERPTDEELIDNIKDFILSLNKNIDNNELGIKEGGIKVNILAENKININELDKALITEGTLYLTKESDTHSFKLTDDGIVEHYNNDNLNSTFPFAKLTLTRECKQLIQDGYMPKVMTEDMNDNADIKKQIMDNPEKAKQDIQAEIDLVDELQAKQNELNAKLDNLLGESKSDNYPEFPSNEFTEEPVIYDDLNIETFNEYLTAEQKAYINAYIGTIDEFVQAMQLLYDEVGDGVAPLISINDYVKEILEYDGGIPEWSQELSDMLGFDLKTEGKSKFYTAENAFDDFIKNVKEDDDEDEDGYYEFQMQDLGITKEATAEFKNLLLQRDEIEDIKYDPQSNIYKVKLVNKQ